MHLLVQFLLLISALIATEANPGKPLFLTPYVRSGLIEQAQKLAKVDKSQFHGVTSYSGYLTVDKRTDSHLFFWHFPAQVNPETAPVLLWLQGGPGVSLMVGVLQRNGPFHLRDTKLELNEHAWTQNHHMIYIDSPVATGYSQTDNGFVQNAEQAAGHLYDALGQFFKLFPHLRAKKFFIGGEGYVGKFATALAYAIHHNNPHKGISEKINLAGLAVGNGLFDPVSQVSYGEYLYQVGLVDGNGKDVFDEGNQQIVDFIEEENWVSAAVVMNRLLLGRSNETTIFTELTGFTNTHNYLIADQNVKARENLVKFSQRNDVRELIHVGDSGFRYFSDEVFVNFLPYLLQSVAWKLTEVLEHYPVLIYAGQLDVICPYPQIVNALNNLQFKDAHKYKTAVRREWRVDGALAGYWKHAGNLMEVFVRNAGHAAVADQPKWGHDMITRLTHGCPKH